MKKDEIPQDESSVNGWTREICYAKNEEGKYEQGHSTGWSIKRDALDNAWDDINDRIENALNQVKTAKASPILYFMELKIMSIGILANYTGFWKWTIRRHLNPNIFKKLSDKTLQKYAEVFEISIEQLKNFK